MTEQNNHDTPDLSQLKVPLNGEDEQPKKQKKQEPELPFTLQQFDTVMRTPASKLLLFSLKAGGYLCIAGAVCIVLATLLGIFAGGVRSFLVTILNGAAQVVLFLSLSAALFALEKVLSAVCAAHADDDN